MPNFQFLQPDQELEKLLHEQSDLRTVYKPKLQNLSIVIPAYNEADRISPTLKDLISNVKNLGEILVVFDGNDSTPTVAKSFGDKVRVLQYPKKLGRGGAVLQGLKDAQYGTVCFIDADNSAPWFEVQKVSNMVSKENPCVIGSRWTAGSKLLKREGYFKIFVGRVWRYLTFLLLGLEMKDAQCGLKCFDANMLKKVLPAVQTTNRMFDVSLLYNIKQLGYDIKEVGIQWSHNDDTRMPYIHIIPVMFMYLIGLRIAHSPVSQKYEYRLKKYAYAMNQFH